MADGGHDSHDAHRRATMGERLSDEQWRSYERDGFLRLGRTISDETLEPLRQRIDEYMLGGRRDDGLMMQRDVGGGYGSMEAQTLGFKGPTLDYRKIENLERDPRFLRYLQLPLFQGICARAYGADAAISCFRAMFMNKPAGKGTFLPWHQDGGGTWGLDRDPTVTVWTALDAATIANGCVQVIPGSHHLGLLSERGHVISDEQVREHCRPERVVHIELIPGEAVLLHNWLLHASDINRTDIPRRAFSVCYMDARTRRARDGKAYPTVFGEGALAPTEMAGAS
jgi:phytanoyl-CoA hydroxylase